MLRKGRLARLAKLSGMATGLVGDAAGAAAHLVTETADQAGERMHRHAAERLARVLGDMKGLPLKAGQMLSYVDELVPEDQRRVYNEVLGKLQMHTPTMEWEHVEAMFQEDFEGRGPTEVFRSFDPEPFAAASIGQVYRAVTHDGEDVVVKIQYPGVSEAFDSDLANIGVLVSAMKHVIRQSDFSLLVGDIVERVKEECDYRLEADSQRAFAARWAGHSEVVVPRTFDELCTARVLTSEYLDAAEWSEMLGAADAELKSAYGRTIFRFVFTSLLCHGMFNGDPHPGNYLFYPDGRVAFIDYGCVQRYSPDKVAALAELREAVLDGTLRRRAWPLMRRVASVPGDLDEEMAGVFENYLIKVFEPVLAPQPYRFTREYSQMLLREIMTTKELMMKKLLRGKKAYPLDLQHGDAGVAFLGRIVVGLASILTTLGTEGDFREILAEMA